MLTTGNNLSVNIFGRLQLRCYISGTGREHSNTVWNIHTRVCRWRSTDRRERWTGICPCHINCKEVSGRRLQWSFRLERARLCTYTRRSKWAWLLGPMTLHSVVHRVARFGDTHDTTEWRWPYAALTTWHFEWQSLENGQKSGCWRHSRKGPHWRQWAR